MQDPKGVLVGYVVADVDGRVAQESRPSASSSHNKALPLFHSMFGLDVPYLFAADIRRPGVVKARINGALQFTFLFGPSIAVMRRDREFLPLDLRA